MKQQLTKHWCINPKCKWEIKTHKLLEGLKCPKCNCPTQLKILKMKPLSILIQNFCRG